MPQPPHSSRVSHFPSIWQVEDNFFDVVPAFVFFGTLVWGVKSLRAKMLRDHRD